MLIKQALQWPHERSAQCLFFEAYQHIISGGSQQYRQPGQGGALAEG